MTHRRTGHIALIGVAVAAALSLTACGSDDSEKTASPSTSSAASTSAAEEANVPPKPSAEELNGLLQRALDPAVPNEEKLNLVQGIEADPELPNRLANAYREAGAVAQVTGVTAFGESLSAQGTLTVNGQQNPVDVPFVADNGEWKVQKEWACTALTNLNQESPACA
ncbi:hypothetical protein GCM10023318_29320 [Nocardia callitridis]|uniref:Low molecular weight antigen MTB12-like C-terminal domain-containing protein n=1 Tax=Nocardia callitridis TaxID=648753 RepID=A0ABP9KC56_9NOCA